MPGTYEHIIRMNIKRGKRIPQFSGPLSCINSFITSEYDHLNRRLGFVGTQIVNDLAISSQKAQRDTITRLKAVRTGRLRDSIRITGEGLEAHVGTSLYYAQYVYEGWGPVSDNYNKSKVNVREYRAGPRPWTEISATEFERSIDGIVADGLNAI